MRIAKGISGRFVVSIGLVVILALVAQTILLDRALHQHFNAEAERDGRSLAETIWRSTRSGMLDGRHQRIRNTINFLTGQEGVRRIRLISRDGRVYISSDPTEEGRRLDRGAAECVACHHGRGAQPLAEARAFAETLNRGQALGVARPIRTRPECQSSGCHANVPPGAIVGVLHVTIESGREQAVLAGLRLRLLAFVFVLTGLVSIVLLLLLDRLVRRPVSRLVDGTRRLAAGDLEHRIPITSDDELGQLARAFNDTTEKLAQAQRQLFEAEKLASLGRLAAGVAHEINNPLTAILTYASAMRDDIPPGVATPQRSDLDAIIGETMRCRDIVRRLLDFARQRPLTKRATNLNDLAERAAKLLERQASFQKCVIVRRFDPALPRVDIDANQIHQVLVNLLLNAADAMPGGGEIAIETRLSPDRQRAQIRVIDTGFGIPSPVRARLFEPFLTTKERGTGLGLSVAWGIVQRHAGALSVESESGRGTTFIVELPVGENAPAAAEAAAPSPVAQPASGPTPR